MQQVIKRLLMMFLGLLMVAGPLHGAEPNEDWDVRAYNLGRGRLVFTTNCVNCHAEGDKGAPVLGETAQWEPRIEQDLSILIKHAIDGHATMPSKGDLENLSDQDAAAAVAYVVYNGRVLLAELGKESVPRTRSQDGEYECGKINLARSCTAYDAPDTLLMQMFWLLTNRQR